MLNVLTMGGSNYTESARKTMIGMAQHTAMGLLLFAVMASLDIGVTSTAMLILAAVGGIGLSVGMHYVRNLVIQYAMYYGAVVCLSVISVPMVTMTLQSDGGKGIVLLASIITLSAIIAATYLALQTKMNLDPLKKVLCIALVMLLVGMVANIFIGSSLFGLMISYVVVVVMFGCMVVEMNDIATGKQTNVPVAAMGMFLNILNMFLHLLNILSDD